MTERWILKLLDESQDSTATFCDIGAGIGYYCILATRTFPNITVHAYEPLATNRQSIAENIALNGGISHAITVHPQALTNSIGMAEFESRGFASALVKRGSAATEVASMLRSRLRRSTIGQVEITTLDHEISQIGSTIALAKVDVQRSEIQVIRGAVEAMVAHRISAWIVSTHSSRIHRKCVEIFEENAYQIVNSEPSLRSQSDGLLVAKLL